MIALSLHQPYASAIAYKLKGYETRSWRTKYRGELLIHAAKSFPRYARQFAEEEVALGRIPSRLPFGGIVCKVELLDCLPTEEASLEISALERHYGDYSPGRFAWKLKLLRVFEEPIPYRGAQGLFYVPDLLVA